MILLTGIAGFIGSNILTELTKLDMGLEIIGVDDIKTSERWKNLSGQNFYRYVALDQFSDFMKSEDAMRISLVIHMGACSNTEENNFDYLVENNYQNSIEIWKFCTERKIPLIYASSAATYGDGSMGFSDDHNKIQSLKPLNAYAYTKHIFDLWTLHQTTTPPVWVGLKFFNVYGPRETHKGKQSSMVTQALQQIKQTSKLRLFKSESPNCPDGEQKRDFVYVHDIANFVKNLSLECMNSSPFESGIYNCGTGTSKTFNELGTLIFKTLNKPINIEYFDMPDHLKKSYQNFTEADVSKISETGYWNDISGLDAGITDYISHLNKP